MGAKPLAEPGADTGTSTGRPMLAVLGGLGRLVTAEWFKRYRENDRPMPRCTRTLVSILF